MPSDVNIAMATNMATNMAITIDTAMPIATAITIIIVIATYKYHVQSPQLNVFQ